MPSTLLRGYSAGDEEAYVYIWNEAYKTTAWYSSHPQATVDGTRKTIQENQKNPTYRVIFVIQESQPIGFIEANMEDAENGRIFGYTPCILPACSQHGFDVVLVKAAMEHLRKCGATKIKYSIMGVAKDTAPYVDLYQSLGFSMQRRAAIMGRNMDSIPDLAAPPSLQFLTLRDVGFDSFVDLFMECFQDSSDRDASEIAGNLEKTRKFMEQLHTREGQQHDSDGWIVASLDDKLVGLAVAIGEEGRGLVAEIGVVPQFRRQGIGTFLTLKALQRLKERGFKQTSLGVDIQNTAAISLYEKLGFKKGPWEACELAKAVVPLDS